MHSLGSAQPNFAKFALLTGTDELLLDGVVGWPVTSSNWTPKSRHLCSIWLTDGKLDLYLPRNSVTVLSSVSSGHVCNPGRL